MRTFIVCFLLVVEHRIQITYKWREFPPEDGRAIFGILLVIGAVLAFAQDIKELLQ